MSLLSLSQQLLYHGYNGTEGWTGFVNEGTWVIFAIILVPVYIMLVAWFTGEPRDTKSGLLGVSYLVGLTSSMWIGMFVLTVIIGLVFYGGAPEPIGAPGP
ncbi:hypothetical protein HTZ84_07415 [Haloterrigena sp. SYSU A558-1]|uniref:Uncharacterized protein n=2 Tax=Haloterrigena TaxID=121871 RepID=M0C190_9EURY|nr:MULTISPECIES: hypothetical protein [Haloterrigena]ELZ16438.1 hypothetical protein C477_15440 [Haloterrigena salina JCM 13891]NUB92037.1 hypothetical protein [Haloterrigena gelatinilytica]NUC72137.1 hypothetical protein [Haloterrigena gelatinilytica]